MAASRVPGLRPWRLRDSRLAVDPLALPGLAFVIALVLFGVSTSDSFLSTFNVSNVLVQVTPLMLIALGQAFVIGSGGFDLSVGSVASLSAVVAATLFEHTGVPLAVVIALGVGLAIGLLNGLLVAAGLEPFLVTLATLGVAQGIALIVRPTPGGVVPEGYTVLADYIGGIPVALPGVLLIALLAAALLRDTRTGSDLKSVGGDPSIAGLLGINVGRTYVKTYLLSAALAALAGLFLVARTRTGDPTIGARFALDSIAAVIVGGTLLTGGRITVFGTVVGSLALGLIPNVMNLAGISTFYQTAAKGVVLVLAILLPSLLTRLVVRRRRTVSALRMVGDVAATGDDPVAPLPSSVR